LQGYGSDECPITYEAERRTLVRGYSADNSLVGVLFADLDGVAQTDEPNIRKHLADA
jgi:hypothetical protein